MHLSNRYLQNYRRRYHSQNGEDGILEYVLQRLPERDRWCVEFGACDGRHLSNTLHFIERHDYHAVMIECNKEAFAGLRRNFSDNPRVHPVNAMVETAGPHSLDNLLKKTPLPREFDLLSIDIDGLDYHVWKSLRNYAPKVVIIEFIVHYPIGENVIYQAGNPEQLPYDGSGITPLVALGREKGYELISQVSCNLIFVRRDYFPIFGIRDNAPESLMTYDHVPFGKLSPRAKLRKTGEILRRQTLKLWRGIV